MEIKPCHRRIKTMENSKAVIRKKWPRSPRIGGRLRVATVVIHWENFSLDRWSFLGDGRLQEVVAHVGSIACENSRFSLARSEERGARRNGCFRRLAVRLYADANSFPVISQSPININERNAVKRSTGSRCRTRSSATVS